MTQSTKMSLQRNLKTTLLWTLTIVVLFGETARAYPFAAPSCGSKSKSKGAFFLLGGAPSKPNSWPWVASLQFYDQFMGFYNHVCGATLISPHWAVTAAHCLDPRVTGMGRNNPDMYKVVFGADDLLKPSGDEQIMDVDRIIVHPDWKPDRSSGFPGDIALIHFSEAVDTFTSGAGFACIPDSDLDFEEADECWMAGWGTAAGEKLFIFSDKLREAETAVMPASECSGHMTDGEAQLLNSHICAGDMDPSGANACKGDSGGPLSCRKGSHWYAAGISSWSYTEDCRPSIYTSLGSYRNWIKQHTGV